MNMPRCTVEIHLAFRWVCDSCGRDNYHPGCKPTADEMREIECASGDHEVPDNWQSEPSVVTCGSCGDTFDAERHETD